MMHPPSQAQVVSIVSPGHALPFYKSPVPTFRSYLFSLFAFFAFSFYFSSFFLSSFSFLSLFRFCVSILAGIIFSLRFASLSFLVADAAICKGATPPRAACESASLRIISFVFLSCLLSPLPLTISISISISTAIFLIISFFARGIMLSPRLLLRLVQRAICI